MPEDLPLDVAYSKLLEFLIDRKKLPEKWQDNLRDVKSQVKGIMASENAFNENVKTVLRGNYTYFDCVRVMSILEDQESQNGESAKNVFGAYKNPHLKAWYGVIKKYEANCTYLGEGARNMTQSVSYEIPSLKKTIQNNEKQLSDLSRKITEYVKTVSNYERRVASDCSDLKIEGKEFRSELVTLASELPAQTKIVTDAVDQVADAVEYHRVFVDYLQKQGENPKEVDLLPSLSALRSAGDSDTMVLDSGFRTSVINDLHELCAFFEQRHEELSEGGGAMVNQFQGAPDLLQQQSADKISSLLDDVSSCLGAFTAKRFTQLVQIKTNPRYLDRLVGSLDQKVLQVDKMKGMHTKMCEKKEELAALITQSAPTIKSAIDETQALKKQMEAELTKLFSRKVNVIGEINSL